MANAHLPRHHYAAKWVADKELKTPEEITDLGLLYVSLPDGSEKERGPGGSSPMRTNETSCQ